MALSKVQLTVEGWIRDTWLPRKYNNQEFTKQMELLSCGGRFEFDAVGESPKRVAVISTSSAKTASDKIGAGKVRKIRSDLYFLLLVKEAERIVLFTESDMFEFWKKEQAERKRVPSDIKFMLVPEDEIPPELKAELQAAKLRASEEVTPRHDA